MLPWIDLLLVHFEDPAMDEVTIIGTQSLCLLARGSLISYPSPFQDSSLWQEKLQIFCLEQHLRLTPRAPSAGGTWGQGGFRWHAILSPLSACGSIFSLRRHRFGHLTLEDFAGEKWIPAIVAWCEARRPLLICGPTGSGKTSFLAILLHRVAASFFSNLDQACGTGASCDRQPVFFSSGIYGKLASASGSNCGWRNAGS